jgi:hypothetical protein
MCQAHRGEVSCAARAVIPTTAEGAGGLGERPAVTMPLRVGPGARCTWSALREAHHGRLIYSAITSLDGYVADAEGTFEWTAPDEEVHALVNDLERPIGTYLYGRRMYEVMAQRLEHV